MVGLGETWEELLETIASCADWKVDILTIGQYLQPSRKHLPIARYYSMEEFQQLKDYGYSLVFRWLRAPRWCAPATTPRNSESVIELFLASSSLINTQ